MTDAQFGTLVGLLTEIRDGLAYLCQPLEDDEPMPECEHQEAQRTDFSTPREVHWTCGACGHIERRAVSTRAPAYSPCASAEE